MNEIKRICIIGNACSGKTTLSRVIAARYKLPLIHIDSIQFLPGMKLRAPDETRKILKEKAATPEWVIDGFGPLNLIEERFVTADLIIFIRISLLRNYWWCVKRQIKGFFVRRAELPENCFESNFGQTLRLFKSIWNVHHGMWPQLDRIFKKDIYKDKVIFIFTSSELKKMMSN